MRLALALTLSLLGACEPQRSRSTHPPLVPDTVGSAAPPASAPAASAASSPLSPSAAAVAWMFGAWQCDVVAHGESATAPETRVHGRLLVDAYMDVWVGAGFEPESPALHVYKGDFYFTHDGATSTWVLVGFMSDGSRYTLSSPGELAGRTEWLGSIAKGTATHELRFTWTHSGEGELEMQMERRSAGGWLPTRWTCKR